MWVEVKTDRYIQRGLVSRAQFKKVMGYDSVTQWWEEQAEEERQHYERAPIGSWGHAYLRQATQISEAELGNYPATFVNAEQADEFVQRLGSGFGLPTEWEQMVYMHAGREGNIPESEQRREIIFLRNSGKRLHETGEMHANPWDIHDALGNALQWSGSYLMPFYYPVTSKESPIDIDELAKRNPIMGSDRVAHGGSCGEVAFICQPGFRHGYVPAPRNLSLGFRVLMTE